MTIAIVIDLRVAIQKGIHLQAFMGSNPTHSTVLRASQKGLGKVVEL